MGLAVGTDLFAPVWTSAMRRAAWLSIHLVVAFAGAWVISLLAESTIASRRCAGARGFRMRPADATRPRHLDPRSRTIRLRAPRGALLTDPYQGNFGGT